MKILAFGASNSRRSINRALARFTTSLIPDAEIDLLDLAEYALPIYSEDLEKELGHPEAARDFVEKIRSADAVIVSFAEHNGSYTAAYKNLFDWASRLDQKVYQGKPSVFLSTSPGPGGAASVLAQAKGSAHFFGVDLRASVSVPSFYDVFDLENDRITNPAILSELVSAVQALAPGASIGVHHPAPPRPEMIGDRDSSAGTI